MKGKCPSCGKIDDYEDKISTCKHCKRGVKLIIEKEVKVIIPSQEEKIIKR